MNCKENGFIKMTDAHFEKNPETSVSPPCGNIKINYNKING